MNSLIITSNEKNIEALNEIFTQSECKPKKIVLKKELDINELKSILQELNKTDLCIMDLVNTKLNHENLYFIMGFIEGNGILSFVSSSASESFKNILDKKSSIKLFSNTDEIVNHLRKKYSDYSEQIKQQNSFTELFDNGIPFTADSFAHFIEKDDRTTCQKFIDAGMNVNSCTETGVPLLCIAARCENFDLLEWLLSLGADLNAVSKDRGYTAVMDSVWKKNYKMTEYLISKGASLDVISTDGQPILVLAVGNGDEKIVQLLVKSGADSNIKDSMDMSAHDYAVLFKRDDLVQIIESNK